MLTLIEKLKRSRENTLQVGKYSFVIRRPTAYQLSQIPEQERKEFNYEDTNTKQSSKISVPTDEALIRRFVVNWVGVNEIDIIPGGDAIPAEFDIDLLVEWLQEHVDMWLGLSSAVWKVYLDRQGEVNDSLGKQEVG